MTKEITARYNAESLGDPGRSQFIPTGIPIIDEALGGLKRKDIIGILGSPGQGQTQLARQCGHAAAATGLRVVHIPLESDHVYEEIRYAVLHSNFVPTSCAVTAEEIKRGCLTKAQEKSFFNQVMPSYQQLIAPNLTIREPENGCSWKEVKEIIEQENSNRPIDLLILDHIARVQGDGAPNDILPVVNHAKDLALKINDRRGLSILTPVVGTYAGHQEAASRNGQWDVDHIFRNPEIAYGLDTCLYVWSDAQLQAIHLIKMGTCKCNSRGSNIPPTSVPVDHITGYVGRYAAGLVVTEPKKGPRSPMEPTRA